MTKTNKDIALCMYCDEEYCINCSEYSGDNHYHPYCSRECFDAASQEQYEATLENRKQGDLT